MGAHPVRVNVVCRNWQEDRVLPRFARYLAAGLGWTLTAVPADPRDVDVYYLMGYFEQQQFAKAGQPWPPTKPVASLFTHREEDPRLGRKARLYDQVAREVQLRVSMCRLYGSGLEPIGPTIQAPLPVERDRFVIAERPRHSRRVLGMGGFVAPGARKGEDVATAIMRRLPAFEWRVSGRGWGLRSRCFDWRDMPAWYQDLDLFVCPSRVEGGPMGALEALSCGVPVVIPRGVGILDEIPDMPGVVRYARGNAKGLADAIAYALAIAGHVDREALRGAVAGHSVEAWCGAHREALARLGAAA